ncbi:hypothetical protein SBOR_1251 [Sclerotinia borealis F-4128]|uniref:Uncharacterized protein n=1 Tax=Sclerotinia borealis (strain F-4128) TaxID=1432307 RepID=W9CQP5_SCLBF|nr:hypothetical protein SBOR_1251 [Sclerotinia borealis F-4128]
MDQINKVKPTMENSNPFHWEMQLLAQEFNEREARQVASNRSHLADQASLREHNHNVAQLENRKRHQLAILDEEQESEIDVINKKYVQKFRELEADYINKRDDLEGELFKKVGRSYKKLQKLHIKNLSQSQEFERKANDILKRMASSLKEENTICVLESVRKVPVAAVAAVKTPPVSSASVSTTPVSEAETIILNQYLEASPSEIQPLLKGEPYFEFRDTPPYAPDALSAPTPPAPHLVLSSSPENHSVKRQKTNGQSHKSAKNNPNSSLIGASEAQDSLDMHSSMQSFSMDSGETFVSHAKSRFLSTKTSDRDLTGTQAIAQYHNLNQRTEYVSAPSLNSQDRRTANGESEKFLNNGSMSPPLISRVRPAHLQEPLDSDLMSGGNHPDFPPAFAQVATRGHASLQTTRPLKRAPMKSFSKDVFTDDTSDIEEDCQGSDFNGRKATLSKRKASDINMDGPFEELPIEKTETPTQIQPERGGSSRAQRPRRRLTNPPRLSNANSTQQVTIAPKPRNTEPIRRVNSYPRPSSAEPTRQVPSTYRPSIAESQLSIVFFSIDFMSYDPGSPAKCYPVSWSGMKGSHNYRLQVMHLKKRILHPYDGAEDKSSQYPKLRIDGSWVLGGFYHKEMNNHRLEIYRPRSKSEYRAEDEEDINPANIQSARIRIKFTSGVELERFLEWYRGMHPGAEMRPNDLLGTFRQFFQASSASDPTLRREIENRAQRGALMTPV